METELVNLLHTHGAALVGFADLAGIPDVPQNLPRAVSIAVALHPAIVASLPEGPQLRYMEEYTARNTQLDALGTLAEAWLQARGHAAWANTRERAPYARDALRTPLPHKTAARLAGHGWVGKCALMINPRYGSALRYTTVLTDAPLSPTGPLAAKGCGGCTNCAKACPAGAIHGVPWRQSTTRDALVDAFLCNATTDARGAGMPVPSASCGLCIAACPFTRQYLRRAGAL